MSFIGTDNEFEIPDVSTERENLIDSNLNQGITIKLAPKQVDVTGIPNDQSNFVEEFGGSFIIKKLIAGNSMAHEQVFFFIFAKKSQ